MASSKPFSVIILLIGLSISILNVFITPVHSQNLALTIDCIPNLAEYDASAASAHFNVVIAAGDGISSIFRKDDIFRLTIADEYASEFEFRSTVTDSYFGNTSMSIQISTVKALQDIILDGAPRMVAISILWKNPSPKLTKPSISIDYIPYDSPSTVYTFANGYPGFYAAIVPGLSTHSLTARIQPDPNTVSKVSIPVDIIETVDTGICTVHNISPPSSKLVLNSNQQLEATIVFGPSIQDHNAPKSILYSFQYYPIASDKIPTETFARSKFDLPIGYTIPADRTLTVPIDLSLLTKSLDLVFVEVTFEFSETEELGTSSSYQQYFSSSLFSVVSSCLSPIDAETVSEIVNVEEWKSMCGSNGICGIYGTCLCDVNFAGDLCQNALDLCRFNDCVQQQTKGCNADATCSCESGWGGEQCQVSDRCAAISLKQCSKNNGFVIPDSEAAGGCGTKCQCNNDWVGDQCETCSLQCQNGGKYFKNCDKCGCQKGFSGDNCQCRSVIGTIIFNAFNREHSKYSSLFFDKNGNQLTPQLTTSTLPILIDYNDIYNKFIAYFVSAMKLDVQSELEVRFGQTCYVLGDTEAIKPSLMIDIVQVRSASPDETGQFFPTKMTLEMTFGCEGNNKNDDSSSIEKKWTQMLEELPRDEFILNNLVFFDGKTPVESGELVQIDDTLPPDDDDDDDDDDGGEEKPNSSFTIKYTMVFIGLMVISGLF